MNYRRTLIFFILMLFIGSGAATLEQSFNTTSDWSNALDHSGVTWDGIQDHANNSVQQGYTYGSISDGLVGYWSFDNEDITDNFVIDRSAYGNNFSYGSYQQPGKPSPVGDSMYFDDNGVRFGDDKEYEITDEITFSVLVKNNGSGTGGISGNYNTYLDKGWFKDEGYSLYSAQAGARAKIGNGTHSEAIGFDTATEWKWYTGVYKKGEYFKGYENGELKGTIPDPIEMSKSPYDLSIGRRTDYNGQRHIGWMGAAVIHDRALSEQEVRKLHYINRSMDLTTNDHLTSGLVGWWPLHETSGSTANDLSENDNDGTLNGGVTQGVAGRGGLTTYSFDGSNDEVRISDDDVFTVDEFTTSAWVKIDSKGNYGIVSNYGGGGSDEHYGIRYGNNGGEYTANVYYDDGGSAGYEFTILYGDTDIGDGRWHHVAGIWDSNQGETNLYIDGVKESASTGEYTGSLNPSADLLIGHDESASHGRFHGSIADPRVYDRALSNSEIDRLYKMGSGDYATPPDDSGSDKGVAYWSFDNADSDTRVVEDEWGNHDGLRGTSGGIGDWPSYNTSSSVRGAALTFDGNDDEVTTGISSLSTPVAFSTWIKPSTVDSSNGQWEFFSNWESTSNDLVFYHSNSNEADGVLELTADGAYGSSFPARDNPLEANKWSHVGFEITSSEASLFINGRQVNSTTSSSASWDSGSNFQIGNRPGDDTKTFDGEIDEVRIYNRSLSKHEISELYQHGTFGRDMRQLTRDKGLVGYWSLDEDSGQNVHDLSGHSNNGTRGNASTFTQPTFTEGVLGTSAYKFDGDWDYLSFECGEALNDDTTEPLTISAWVTMPTSQYATIVGRQRGTNPYNGIDFQSDGNDIQLVMIDSNGNHLNKKIDWPFAYNSQWHHVTVTYDGLQSPSGINYYFDGEKGGTVTLTNDQGIADSTGTAAGCAIGARNPLTSAGSYFYQGKIDEVRIYNRSLTPSEVQSLYSTSKQGEILTEWNAGGPIEPDLFRTDWSRPDAPGTTNLVGAWRLNEDHGSSSSGDSVSDWSGSGNSGTTNGGITTHVDGAFDGSTAYDFDGNDDWVDAGNDQSLDGFSSLTLSGWVKPTSAETGTIAGKELAYRLDMNSGETFEFFVDYESGWNARFTAGEYTTDEWHHVSMVYDGDKTRGYVNGEAVGSSSDASGSVSSSRNFGIGAYDSGSGTTNRHAPATIDSIRIYSTALSHESIKALYHTSTVTADAIGSQGTSEEERNDQDVPYPDGFEAGPKTYDLDWSQPHENIRLNTKFNTYNITKAATLSNIVFNTSKYTPSTTNQFLSGFFSGVSADEGRYGGNGDIRLGQGENSDESLVGHWNFEPKNPGNITDVSGNGNDGELIGEDADASLTNFEFDTESNWASGEIGTHAVKLGGDDESVRLNDPQALNFGKSDFSISMWLNADELNPRQGIFGSTHEVNLQSGEGTVQGGLTSGGFYLQLGSDSNNVDTDISLSRSLRTKTWYNVILLADRDGNAQIYINGDQEGSLDISGQSGVSISNDNTERFGEFQGAWQRFNGTLDDIRYYNRSLSATEINFIADQTGDPRRGLIGEWTFDEGKGTVAHDTSKWTTGVRQGKALEFDGSDDRIDGTGLQLDGKTFVTISAWINMRSLTQQTIVSTYNGNGLQLEANSDGSIDGWYYYNSGGDADVWNSGETYSSNQWLHIVVVKSDTWGKLYVQGEEKDSWTPSGDIYKGKEVEIGSRGGGGRYFNGKIDDVRIYSRALTPSEVSELYTPSPGYWSSGFFDAGNPTKFTNLTWNEELQGGTDTEARVQLADNVSTTEEKADWDAGTSSIAAHDNLVGYWRFEDPSVSGSGGTVKDWSGQGNDGTAKNGVDTKAEGFRPQSNAYRFDGSDDYIEINSPAVPENHQDYSVSLWFKQDQLTDFARLVRRDQSTDGWQFGIDHEDQKINWNVDKNNGVYKKLDKTLETDRWYHLVVTRDDSTYNGYVNGHSVPVISGESWGMGGSDLLKLSDPDRPFDGAMDEVRIYDRALSSSEIRSSYSSMTWTSSWMKWPESHYDGPEPVSRWEFSRGAGQTVEDIEGSNDGTLGGSTVAGQSLDPEWVPD